MYQIFRVSLCFNFSHDYKYDNVLFIPKQNMHHARSIHIEIRIKRSERIARQTQTEIESIQYIYTRFKGMIHTKSALKSGACVSVVQAWVVAH